jgi:hypothetical protein
MIKVYSPLIYLFKYPEYVKGHRKTRMFVAFVERRPSLLILFLIFYKYLKLSLKYDKQDQQGKAVVKAIIQYYQLHCLPF